jgi:hypothetical protein
VAARLESTNLAKAAQYYRTWLERASTAPPTSADAQAVADGLYRIARTVNGMADSPDLRDRPEREAGPRSRGVAGRASRP